MTAKLLVASRALYNGMSRALRKAFLIALLMTAIAAAFVTSLIILVFRLAS